MRLPDTHIVEDFQVCVHSEMMHLTLKRLEAPGSLEVRWGAETSLWRLGVGEKVWDVNSQGKDRGKVKSGVEKIKK